MIQNQTLSLYLNTLRQKGYLAYEYNPFHNYQTNVDLYEKEGFLIPKNHAVNKKNGQILTKKGGKWIDDRGNVITENVIEITSQDSPLYVAGSLIDFDTDKLNFDLEHPVDITIQPSYDGSVNLILNDDKNIPRLINSRFSVREKGTYEIVDRIGENDTNIYNSETFDKDTSLYFQYEQNPTVEYNGIFSGGNLLSGSYCFYFTYCDSDNNESDIIAESGPIPVFIGSDKDPFSIEGGIKNINTYKQIGLKLTNMDKSYNYFKVYYVRYFADYQQNKVYECKKIFQKYPIKSSVMYLQITGNEEAEDLDANLLNIVRFNPKSILTQTQCKNMLFFGNIVKNTDNYKELQDCALRIIPRIEIQTLSDVDNKYNAQSGDTGYYNSFNIYNKTGYFNQEYYRFGVVFIYKNGTLSNVYNTLGGIFNNDPNKKIVTKPNTFYDVSGAILKRKYIEIDDYGWIKNQDNFYNTVGEYLKLNSKGVCKINQDSEKSNTIYGIKFDIPQEVVNFLKEDLDIRGLFFVRQKRIPNLIAQCYLMPMDELLEAPVLELQTQTDDGPKSKYFTECFLTQGELKTETIQIAGHKFSNSYLMGNKLIANDYLNRLYEYENDSVSKNAYAGICPDFMLNQPYYNQIFNGSKFNIQQVTNGAGLVKHGDIERNYISQDSATYSYTGGNNSVIISSVTDDVPTVSLKSKVFKLKIGQTEEAYRFQYCEVDKGATNIGDEDYDSINNATNLVRGNYSPYLAIYSTQKLKTGELYNIYLEEQNNENQNFLDRMNSSEPFYAISDRLNFEALSFDVDHSIYSKLCWRGDCYVNTFTYRLNRNFNDPSLPNNDKIIDAHTWDNYDASNPDNWSNISRSDVNAVQMGSWITFKCRSYMNYALRSQDHSYVSEEALMGAPRSYYPKNTLMWHGENKLPDSYVFNDAYRTSLGFKCYYTLSDINYIKDTFSNRIQYSAVSIQDSFKNNYRESLSTYFRDYSQEYGGITKLIGFEGHLLVVLEHAIGIATVNERVLASSGESGEPVFINTKNVLPEELTIISDTIGSQWSESVIKSEAGYVYGVDTIAKKIWRVQGQQLEILSDFRVNKFLVDNISLGEHETSPIIGLRNVKTHYNNNKKDIMFTFYDDIYKDEEKVWNLCFNELLNQFITFYSWVPSYSENIDTQFFSFNRETSKELTLLDKCNYNKSDNTGILLDTPILDNNNKTTLHYVVPKSISIKSIAKDDYKISTENCEINCQFKLEKDHWGNYKWFNQNLVKNGKLELIESKNTVLEKLKERNSRTILLEVTPYIGDENIYYKSESIAVTFTDIIDNNKGSQEYSDNIPDLYTDFFLHGQAGIFNVAEDLYPTHWYGEYHPFEFEFVVNDKIGQQKIFENLVIISNKAEPESFHFEIEGDNYEFSEDKRTMYFRQEATKNLYQNLGSDMLYDRDFTDVIKDPYTYEQYYRTKQEPKILDGETKKSYDYKKIDRVYPINSHGLIQQVKSTIFPLYYERIDTYNNIYDKYTEMTGNNYDFKNLSGSEIKWDRDSNQFDIVTHIKNSPIDLVGRLRGNSRYKEGKWNVQIPSIVFNQKNENVWKNNIPPIVINSSNVPKDLTSDEISMDKIPNIYTRTDRTEDTPITEYVNVGDWTYRKEARIRDKWMKVKVRYSGKNLAVIHSLITLYNISYS